MQFEFAATQGDWLRSALEAKDKRQYWKQWQDKLAKPSDSLAQFCFVPRESDIVNLPPLSFFLRIPFRLQKSYISRDENVFSLLDNPLRKDKVFRAPMVAASSWKGALRAALWQLGHQEDDELVRRLFGNPRTTEEGLAGRLHFCATFFSSIGLEVINPHNRETGVGERPILMECVPPENKGDFVLFYVPFGPIGQKEEEKRSEFAQDLEIVAEGIQAMLTVYGFGAKTSSGYGIAGDKLPGKGVLVVRDGLPDSVHAIGTTPRPAQHTPVLPRYLESTTRLHPDFRQADDSLKPEADYESLIKSRGGQYNKKDKLLYSKAQKWWQGKERPIISSTEISKEVAEPPQTPKVTKIEFETLEKLRELAKDVGRAVKGRSKE